MWSTTLNISAMMKNLRKTFNVHSPWLLLLALLISLSIPAKAADSARYEVVPLPTSIVLAKGKPFLFTSHTSIYINRSDSTLARLAVYLREYVQEATGMRLQMVPKPLKDNCICLLFDAKASGEGYKMHVDHNKITIKGSVRGIFYGIQTLRKSLPPTSTDSVLMPAVDIADEPRFPYRGMMLDCARHFFSVDEVKTFIDMLALHNMNTFHWHLSDDQGWRIEIKHYPRLTSVGSRRTGTVIGHNSDLDDGIPYGGYYTQEEIRDVVRYAADRFITVIPEIDMPGHTLAALASYPELGCTGGPYAVGHRWGIGYDVLCVGNPATLRFVKNVLSELMDLFPSKIIDIGGDETLTTRWDACPRCKALGTSAVQALFTQEVERFVASKGRRVMGWDEILDFGASPEAVVMSWRGGEPGVRAAMRGHDVVMAPTTHCYFDFCQTEDVTNEPSAVGKAISVEKVYGYEPVSDTIPADAARHILGVQANLWTEHVVNFQVAQYQTLPRMAALAEVQWTPRNKKDFSRFKHRLSRLTRLYDSLHWKYALHLWPDRRPNPWYF